MRLLTTLRYREGFGMVAALVILATAGCVASVGQQTRTTTGSTLTSSPAFAADVRFDYPADDTCYSEGYPHFVIGGERSSRDGWLDVGGDGEADVLRSGGRVYVRLSALESSDLSFDRPWVSVPADRSDPINDFAHYTTLRRVGYSLLDGADDPFQTVESLRESSRTAGSGSQGTGSSSRMAPGDPNSPLVEWSEDSAGLVERIVITPKATNGSTSSRAVLTRAEVREQPIARAVPPAHDVSGLADVPVLPLLLTSELWDPVCVRPTAPEPLDSRRQCISRVAQGISVKVWTEQRPQNEWFSPHECP